MSNVTKNMYINRFLRGFPSEFTLDEFIKYMSYVNFKITKNEAENIIFSSQYVFELENNHFITRSGAFTGKHFSAVLSEEECKNKCFLVGHSCIPFVDQELMSFSLIFLWNFIPLENKVVEFSKEFALDKFSLFGEEYESQYIANDPAMADYNFDENDFELPMRLKLTSVDLSPLFEKYDIQPGDRLLFSVDNWDQGIVNVTPCLREKSKNLELTDDDIKRNQWYKNFEKAILNSFDTKGPRTSIEEQLAEVFYNYSDELCIQSCGSVEEFLKHSKEVSIELYGVETRLWKSGQFVPALGAWNNNGVEDTSVNRNLMYSVPDYVVDEYIKDFAFQKKHDLNELMDEIFPSCFYIPSEYRQELLLHIANRNDIILHSYNWFKDYQLGEIRHKALKLFTKINGLVYEIDKVGGQVSTFPQQELVILIQLFSHLSKLIESLVIDQNMLVKESAKVLASLEGMKVNFEEIEGPIQNAVVACKKNDFTLI